MNKAFKKHFNPYRNQKTLQWAIDNDDSFIESIEAYDTEQCKEAFGYPESIHSSILNTIGCYDERDKAARWAEKNFEYLEFSFEYSTGYYSPELGRWRKADNDEPRQGGIFVCSMPLSEEIELQADDGSLVYLYVGPRALNVLAAVA